MIYLNQNTNNAVYCTPGQNQRGTGSLFLFEFIKAERTANTSTNTYCLAYDSASLNRYNLFTITSISSGSAVTASAGQVYLPIQGQYTYNIYEVVVSGSLSPSGLNVCETGLLTVLSSSASTVAYNSSRNGFIV